MTAETMTRIEGGQGLASFAQRVVRGAVAFMAATTVAATLVGFWLSYAGLHAFARRSGLHGAEAWAWPASVDLFIMVGEFGLTISAIRRKRDPLAWVYLLAGFGPSVLFNIMHVVTVTPWWGRYAVAAVPPVAAMLALAALMRQVFRLAVEAHLQSAPEAELLPALGPHPETAPALNGAAHPDRTRTAPGPRTRTRTPSAPRGRTRTAPVTAEDAESEFMTELAAGRVPSLRAIRSRLHVGQDRATEIKSHLSAITTAGMREVAADH